MGREIRRVPADWEHPRDERGVFKPLYDRSYREAATEWKDGYAKWESGEDPDRAERPDKDWWEWHGDPPRREYYRPDWPEGGATHYQVYETVSEGTPVTPHFATKAELIDYLVEHGDFWDVDRAARGRQERAGWSRAAATQFVEREWAPSLMIMSSDVGTVIHAPRDGDLPRAS